MTLFLVRDDDPNATTDPEMLERGYAPLLDAGIPITFATIPDVRLDTRAPDGTCERFLHPDSPDGATHVRMVRTTPLAQWLRAHASQVDVFVHGLTHERVRAGTEFGALDAAESASRLLRGRGILREALDREPVGFVAPWDAMSADALRACADQFELVSTGWVDRGRLPASAWPAHVLERLGKREALRVKGSWVVRHRGGRIHAGTPPESVPAILDALGAGADVAVVVLHHWMFWEGADAHPVVRALGRALATREVGTLRAAIQCLDARPRWRRAG